MKKFKLKKDNEFHKSLPILYNVDESELQQDPINRINGTTKGFGYSGSVLSLDENGSLLEGTIPLQILLPKRTVPIKMNVEAKTPMMDLLVQVTTSNGINPGGMYLKVPTDRPPGYLHYKPNTPIGTLNCDSTLEVVPKFEICERPRKQTPKKANLPFEPTIRIQVDLPKNQKSVFRLSPQLTLNEVHRRVCQETKYNVNSYELRTSQSPGLDLDDLSVKLGESGTVHFVLVSTKANLSKSTGDLFELYSKMQVEEKEKQKSRGLFWFLRRKKRKGMQTGTGKGSDPNLSVDQNSDYLYRATGSKPMPPVRPLSLQFEKNGLIDYDDDEDAPAGSTIYETNFMLKNAAKKRPAPKPPAVETPVQTKLIQPPLSSYAVNNNASSSNDSVIDVVSGGDGSKKNHRQTHERRYSDSTSSGYHEDSSAQSPSPELVIPSIALDKHQTVANTDSYVVERNVSEKSGSSGQSSTTYNRPSLIESKAILLPDDDHQRRINRYVVGAAATTDTTIIADEIESKRKFRAPPPPPAYVETKRSTLPIHFLEKCDGGLLIEPDLMTEEKFHTSKHTSRSSSPATVEEVDQNFKEVIEQMEAEITADSYRERDSHFYREAETNADSLHRDVYDLQSNTSELSPPSRTGVSRILIEPIEDNETVNLKSLKKEPIDEYSRNNKLVSGKHATTSTPWTDNGLNEDWMLAANLQSRIHSDLVTVPGERQARSRRINIDRNSLPLKTPEASVSWTDNGLKENWKPSVDLPVRIYSGLNVISDEPTEDSVENWNKYITLTRVSSSTPFTGKGLKEDWEPSISLPSRIYSEISRTSVTPVGSATSLTGKGLKEEWEPSTPLPSRIYSEISRTSVTPVGSATSFTGKGLKEEWEPSVSLPARIYSEISRTSVTPVGSATSFTGKGLKEDWEPSIPLPSRIYSEISTGAIEKQIEPDRSSQTSLSPAERSTSWTDRGLKENWMPSEKLPAKLSSVDIFEPDVKHVSLLETAAPTHSWTDKGLQENWAPNVALQEKILSEFNVEPVEPKIKTRRLDTGKSYKQTLFTTVEPSVPWTDRGLRENWAPLVDLPAKITSDLSFEQVQEVIRPKQTANVKSSRRSWKPAEENPQQIKIEPERNWKPSSSLKVEPSTSFTDKGLIENWSSHVDLPTKINSEINMVEAEELLINPIKAVSVPIDFEENNKVTRNSLQPVVTRLNDDWAPKQPILIPYNENMISNKRPSLPKTTPPVKDEVFKNVEDSSVQKKDSRELDDWYSRRSEKKVAKHFMDTDIIAQVGRPNVHGLNENWEPSVPIVIDSETQRSPMREDIVSKTDFDNENNLSKVSPKPSPRSNSSLSSMDSPLKLSIVDMSDNNSSNVSSPKFLRDYKDSPRMNNTMSPRPYQPISPQSRISFTDPKRNYYPSMTVKNFEDEYYAKEMNDDYMRTMKYGYVDPEDREKNKKENNSVSSSSSLNVKPVPISSKQERRKTTEISLKINSPTNETNQKELQQKTFSATPVVAVGGDEEVLLYQEYEKLQIMFSQWQERLKHNESVVKRGGKLSALEILEFQRCESALMKQHQLVEKLCPEVKSDTLINKPNDVSPKSIKKELTNYQNHSNSTSHQDVFDDKKVDTIFLNDGQQRVSPPSAKDEKYRKRTVDVIRSTRNPQGGENDDYQENFSSNNLLIDSELNNSSIDTSSTLKPTQMFPPKKRLEKPLEEPRLVSSRDQSESTPIANANLYQNRQNGGDYGYGYGYGNSVSKTIFISNTSTTPPRRTTDQPGLYVSKVNLSPQYQIENVENLSSADYYDVQIRENRSSTGPIMEPRRDHRSTYFIPPPPVPTSYPTWSDIKTVSMSSLTVNQDGTFITDDEPNPKDDLLRSIREFGSSGHLKHI